MDSKPIKFRSANHILTAKYFFVPNSKGAVFIIHGGGLSPRQVDHFLEFQKILAENGIISFAFNHSGISPSGGKTEKSSLAKRFEESKTALNFFQKLPRSVKK